MKTTFKYLLVAGTVGIFSCSSNTETNVENANPSSETTSNTEAPTVGQSEVYKMQHRHQTLYKLQ